MKHVGLIRKGAAFAFAALAALSISGCGAHAGAGDAYRIGVLQLTEHVALDAANRGFVRALDDSGIDYSIDQQSAQNDLSACQTIATKFVGDRDDVIFAIATPAAQAAAGATSEIPVVGTAITDFAASGLVKSNGAPGGNLTGTSDMTPVAAQIQMLHEVLPEARTVGLLYASNESNSEIQIEMAEAALDELGIAHRRYTVSSTNEIQSVVESAMGKVDALYAPTDNTIAQGAAQVGQICLENKVPFITGEEGMCAAGGLFTLSIDYEELGYEAGLMAVRILKGEIEPADTPIGYYPDDKLVVVKNEKVADALDIDLSVLDK